MLASALVSLLLLQATPAGSKPAARSTEPGTPDKDKEKEKDKEKKEAEEQPVVTQHQLTIAGRVLKYSVTAGLLPLKNE